MHNWLMKKTALPSILAYTDYRKFLADFYQTKKNANAHFTYRTFSTRAGLASPSHFKMVASGERNLSLRSIPKFATALGLAEKEKRYFELLVQFNQTAEAEPKAKLFSELLKIKGSPILNRLEREKYSFLSTWYLVAIYVLVGMKMFKPDPKWMAQKLKNKVTPKQAQDALLTLTSLGMIKKDAHGTFIQCDGAIDTGDETRSLAVFEYHKAMLGLAGDSLKESLAKQESTEFNGVTLSAHPSQIPAIKAEIREFRKRINALTSGNEKNNQAYQLNIQLFPLTEELESL